jgi:hypothetical protein
MEMAAQKPPGNAISLRVYGAIMGNMWADCGDFVVLTLLDIILYLI